MPRDYVVCRSALIETEHEARQYYQQRLAGAHEITCGSRPVVIVFPRGANHVYTEGANATLVAGGTVIRRRLRSGVYDARVFSLDRARLMDGILPAIERYTVSVAGTSQTGRRNRLLHGPIMSDGRYLRVVLGPSDNATTWYCKSAYPVSAGVWRSAYAAKRARFPP